MVFKNHALKGIFPTLTQRTPDGDTLNDLPIKYIHSDDSSSFLHFCSDKVKKFVTLSSIEFVLLLFIVCASDLGELPALTSPCVFCVHKNEKSSFCRSLVGV